MRYKHTRSKPLKCPYCGRPAILRKASYVYKRPITQFLYVCAAYPECNAYVTVHNGTKKPKGTLANPELRRKRIQAHKIFDSIWKNGIMTKANAYRWMQAVFSLSEHDAHIGKFSNYMCDELIALSETVLENNKIA